MSTDRDEIERDAKMTLCPHCCKVNQLHIWSEMLKYMYPGLWYTCTVCDISWVYSQLVNGGRWITVEEFNRMIPPRDMRP